MTPRKICSKCGVPQQWELWCRCPCGGDFVVAPTRGQRDGDEGQWVTGDELAAEQFVADGRRSFATLCRFAIVAIAALPFTFGSGPISTIQFLGAIVVAAFWFVTVVLTFRTRKPWAFAAWCAFMLSQSLLGLNHGPLSQSFQWICYVVIFTGAPLLLFRNRILRLARLNEPADSVASVTDSAGDEPQGRTS